MDVHHEVAARRVLHHKTHMLRRLETRKQIHQERVLGTVHSLKDPLLTHQTERPRERETP